ncbi:uncharacterized protein LOC143232145 isoform X2 [Tachypleus tridentatus]|uniref:uncharacterized protein LOC143232145 isoform X2 n=1 Tax=Tachypleus tridentatus TaxID=6853 RepID=UPI003FCFF70D
MFCGQEEDPIKKVSILLESVSDILAILVANTHTDFMKSAHASSDCITLHRTVQKWIWNVGTGMPDDENGMKPFIE